jgi:2-polyprenyl-6-methoxyphenol hydroxylase-like FAD-dependent oxidoreductase
MANSHIRLAIIGGGVAGATLANALIQVPHVDVDVFESAPEFSERGAAVILSSTAQKSLFKAVPRAREMLQRAGAVPMKSTRLVFVSAGAASRSRVPSCVCVSMFAKLIQSPRVRGPRPALSYLTSASLVIRA